MGMGSSVVSPDYFGTRSHLEYERWLKEFARIEGKRGLVVVRMFAAARASVAWRGRSEELHERVLAACDRLYPFPTREDCAHLPLPVWIADERLACEGCGTKSFRPGHLEGFRITGCSNCPKDLKLTGGRTKPAKV